jgi:hypothetical protein
MLRTTTFVDFVSATGTARITRVRAAKKFYDDPYSPERDYYKGFRDRVEVCFDSGWDAKSLTKSLTIVDARKADNYEECRKGLTTWVGRKKVKMLSRVRGSWTSGTLQVTVNPELHLDLNGTPYVVKMHLKSDKLSQSKANLSLHLLGKVAPQGTMVGILDVRRSKLYTPTVLIAGMDALLDAEAAALASMWGSV